MTKIIFLDVDGPLIPYKADWLPKVQGKTQMDPCAVSMLKRILDMDPSIQLVISSSHATSGIQHCKDLLAANDIPWVVHRDWWTSDRKMSSERYHEIRWWLDEHPEIDTYVAVDDLPLHPDFVPNAVRCDEFEGFSYLNMLECMLHLKVFPRGLDERAFREKINWHIKRTIWNRTNDCRISTILEELFPRWIVNEEQ